MTENGWNEWKNLVLYKLESQENGHAEIKARLDLLVKEVATLKIKAGIWGVLAGTVPGILTALYMILGH